MVHLVAAEGPLVKVVKVSALFQDLMELDFFVELMGELLVQGIELLDLFHVDFEFVLEGLQTGHGINLLSSDALVQKGVDRSCHFCLDAKLVEFAVKESKDALDRVTTLHV